MEGEVRQVMCVIVILYFHGNEWSVYEKVIINSSIVFSDCYKMGRFKSGDTIPNLNNRGKANIK